MMVENGSPADDETAAGDGDVEALSRELEEVKAKAEANLAGWQRSQADFVNFKRRCEQDMSEMTQFANASLILNLLPVLDDFERAFTSSQVNKESLDPAWVEGMKLIEKKFKSILEMQGVSVIKTKDEPFDPRVHEAIKEDKGKEGIIVQEVQKGYKLGEKVLRPARVIVGSGENSSDTE